MFCIVGALNRESYISALICLDDSVEAFFFMLSGIRFLKDTVEREKLYFG